MQSKVSPLDTSQLYKNDKKLKTLKLDENFILLPPRAFKALLAWYPPEKKYHPLKRKVIKYT